MNSFIETLNQYGDSLLSFAWPMLWQSSLLIAALFAFDLRLRLRLRASIRYTLWLVVLVKLCVPPTLALPTSPVWWLHKAPPPAVAKPLPHYTVTYDNGPLPEIPQTSLAAVIPPKPAMTNAAWLLAASVVISSVLLLWLLVRWWQITRLVRRAGTSERLVVIADNAQQFIGLNSKVRVMLTTNSMSPAVCGLFRPVILIPQSLAENFSDEQMRAVLLHELIHLRRRDVWVNFVQALLQIVYWWHPLVWLANARIRQVREEAVDDAVMLTLRDEAESYAPTLLEVAKLALNRPLASLGLVGILESRHSLRQRIERLVDFRPPRRSGLTLVSLLGILAFTAIAVPMGDGPVPSDNEISSAQGTVLGKTNSQSVLIQAEIYRMRQTDFEKLVSDPAFLTTRKDEVKNFQQFERLVKASDFSPIARPRIQTASGMPAQFYVGNETNSIEFESLPLVTNGVIKLANHIKMISTVASVMTTNNTDTQTTLQNGGGQIFSIRQTSDPGESNIIVVTVSTEVVTNTARFQQRLQAVIKRGSPTNTGEVQILVQDAKLLYEMGKWDEAEVNLKAALVLDSENAAAKYYLGLVQTTHLYLNQNEFKSARKNIVEKLYRIRLDRVVFEAVPLGEVVRILHEQSKILDPDHRGINFLLNPNPGQNVAPTIDPATGLPMATAADNDSGLISIPITIRPPLTNLSLGDVLDALVKAAPEPIRYSVQDYAIVISPYKPSVQLYSRHFRVDANTFMGALHINTGMQTNDITAMAKDFFKTLGVNLDMPGKSIFFNDGLSELFVRATAQDLDTIENTLEVFNRALPQIHIKARFIEVPKGTLAGLDNVIAVTNPPARSNQVAGFVGILTDKNFRTVLHNLEARSGVETLAEPEVVTTSGRQTQMRATAFTSVVTNMAFQEMRTNLDGMIVSNSIVPQTSRVETGPVLDVVPYVLSDGYTINLMLTPSLIEFLGYDTPPTNAVEHINDAGVHLPVFLPRFSIRQVVATLNLWDNQTVVLSGLPEKNYVIGKEAVEKSKASRTELVVFITATVVDSAGNRVHADKDLPFAKNAIPSQPK